MSARGARSKGGAGKRAAGVPQRRGDGNLGYSIEQLREAVERHGSVRAAARALGYTSPRNVNKRLAAAGLSGMTNDPKQTVAEAPIAKGNIKAIATAEWPLPRKGKINRYIFTCAQNNTFVHSDVWENIQALADYYDARVCVSTFTYDLTSYKKGNVKRGKDHDDEVDDEPWYDPAIEPFILDERVQVAPGLVWCGEMNILPTAVTPLSGLESYTGRKSGIFPHVKFAMESIASGKFEGTKFNYTTGTVTQRNYIAKKAGLKAEFHHGYGAVLVEVDHQGDWFVRQLNADSEGTIYDFDLCAKDGAVTDGHRVEAISWGDVHVGRVSRDTEQLLWRDQLKGMGPTLRPKYQFMHDVLDWRARNHHEMKNFHRMFQKFVEGKDDVVAELRDVAHFLDQRSQLEDCQTLVVRSNHDAAFDRWLREADYKADLKNAQFFLQAQLAMVTAIKNRDSRFLPIEWALETLCPGLVGGVGAIPGVRFLRQDESFVICPDANGGIECTHHGDKGANGSRGAIVQFAKSGRKTNTGDSHSAGIRDGAYRAGVTGEMDHGYNEGMSSWSNSHIVTYPNGKRTIVTCWNNKWRAVA
jgi:hypothetical protein